MRFLDYLITLYNFCILFFTEYVESVADVEDFSVICPLHQISPPVESDSLAKRLLGDKQRCLKVCKGSKVLLTYTEQVMPSHNQRTDFRAKQRLMHESKSVNHEF